MALKRNTNNGVKTLRDHNQSIGTVPGGTLLPYFGITKNSFVGGRYHSGSVEESNFIQVTGVVDYYTAKGVETAIIELNTTGFSSTKESTRVDNDRISTENQFRTAAGRAWLDVNKPGWRQILLRPKN